MGKQAVLASLVDVWKVDAGGGEIQYQRTQGWIDASLVASSTFKFDLFMNTVTREHSGAQTAAPLFDAINNIHTNNTKWTSISIESTGGNANSGSRAYILIEIDWEALRVKWSGGLFEEGRNGIFQGDEPIDPLGSRIEMRSWSRDSIISRGSPTGYSWFVYLETGPGRKLVQLPLFFLNTSTSSWLPGVRNISSYAITTDDGMTVSVTPQAPPVAEEVSGIKISELNAADSLSNTDLFVLSRDDPAGDAYDSSLNVTLANLKSSLELGIELPSFPYKVPAVSDNTTWRDVGHAVTNGAKAAWFYYETVRLGWSVGSRLTAWITHSGDDITTGWTNVDELTLAQHAFGAGDDARVQYSGFVLVPVITTPSAGRGFYLNTNGSSVPPGFDYISFRGWVF